MSDFGDSSPPFSDFTGLHELNDDLQRENNKLKDELIAANAREDQLRLEIQNLQIELTAKKQEIEDLKGRIEIVDSIRTTSEKAVVSSLDEERFFHHQELTQLKQEIAKLKDKEQSLTNERTTLKKDIESAQKEAFDRKTQLDNVFSRLSIAFSMNFTTIDELVAFLAARPHFEAQQTAELEKMKSRESKLKHQLKKRVSVIRHCSSEIQRLNSEIDRLETASNKTSKRFERELSLAEKEIDSIHRSSERRIRRLQTNYENAKNLTQIPPNMLLYRSPPISVPPTPTNDDPDKLERTKDKLHKAMIQISELESENKNYRKKTDELAQKVKELESQNSNLEMQRKCIEVNLNEANSQLQLLRDNSQKSKERKLWVKLKAARSKASSDSATIEGLQKNILELNKQIECLESKLTEERVQLARLALESKPQQIEEQQTVVVEAPRPRDAITFRDCYVEGLPSEVESEIKQVVDNPQVQDSAKVRSILQSVVSHFRKLIDESESAYSKFRGEVDSVHDTVASFLIDLPLPIVGKSPDLKEFLGQANVRQELASRIKDACERSERLDECCERIAHLKKCTERLAGKLQKCRKNLAECDCSQELAKVTAQNRTMKDRITSLEAQVNDLAIQRNNLQETIESQQRELIQKVQAARTETLTDYEDIITKLKQRCSDQEAKIQNISRHISTL